MEKHLSQILEVIPEDKVEIINETREMIRESHNLLVSGIEQQNLAIHQSMLNGMGRIIKVLEVSNNESTEPVSSPATPPIEPTPDMENIGNPYYEENTDREPYQVNPTEFFSKDFTPTPQRSSGAVKFDGNGNPIPFGTVNEAAQAGSIIGGE